MFEPDDILERYRPRPAPLFRPTKIVLAKGANHSDARRRLAERICAVYPDAEVVEAFDTPHNRVDLGEAEPLRRHERGKQTLVLADHHSAVRLSQERGNACPNYWHFSPYGFCPYGCHYCYLAGTQGVWFSPAVKIFLNLPEILAQVDRTAQRLGRPAAFYLGKLQDGLALEPLSGYARAMVPLFARHRLARMVVLTKSADVENLLDLDHAGRTILSWTLNAPDVARRFEEQTPDVAARIAAMRRCAQAGYPVRAVLMPIVPVEGWPEIYGRFLTGLLESVPLSRITLGGICSYGQARRLMEGKLGDRNAISAHFDRQPERGSSDDGRLRYPRALREEVYRQLIACIGRVRPDLEIGLCLEDEPMFAALDLRGAVGRCNCVV